MNNNTENTPKLKDRIDWISTLIPPLIIVVLCILFSPFRSNPNWHFQQSVDFLVMTLGFIMQCWAWDYSPALSMLHFPSTEKSNWAIQKNHSIPILAGVL